MATRNPGRTHKLRERWFIPLSTTDFSTIQTVVGLGISEASTVFLGIIQKKNSMLLLKEIFWGKRKYLAKL